MKTYLMIQGFEFNWVLEDGWDCICGESSQPPGAPGLGAGVSEVGRRPRVGVGVQGGSGRATWGWGEAALLWAGEGR